MDELYRAIGVIEGCMISTRLQLAPGISLHPLTGSVLREAERLLVNDILSQAGLAATFTSEAWHINADTTRPVVVVVLHEFPAPTAAEAAIGARRCIGMIADILALHRGAAARLIATAVVRVDESEQPALFNESPRYRGNLLGGAISGEDAAGLNKDLLAATRDRVLQLWLGMAKEATKESDPEFAVARWWNLLEAMATARQARGVDVFDFAGQRLRNRKGNLLSTNNTQARVHEHIRGHFDRRSIAEQSAIVSDTNRQGTGSLWKTLGGWLGLRNAVLHYGRFDPASVEQAKQQWYADAVEARNIDLARGVHYQKYRIRELACDVLRWELDDALSP
ncbi:MAG TPA: hypothetical protein VNA57_08445 [Acidimicrobiales bacterium]|nr:hypothetical protein [Acidimicrobiales bacterium]